MLLGADDLDRTFTSTSVDWASSPSNRFKVRDRTGSQTEPYFDFNTDERHWGRNDLTFNKDSINVGRTQKTAWWDHAQSTNYTTPVDKMYETTNTDLGVTMEKSPIRYKTLQTEHARYPENVIKQAKKITTLGPGEYNHKHPSQAGEYEPPRCIVAFGSTANRRAPPPSTLSLPQKSLYKSKSMTSSVRNNFSFEHEAKRWFRNSKAIPTAKRGEQFKNTKLHLRIQPLLTKPREEDIDSTPQTQQAQANHHEDDDDEFGDPFEWMYDQPNGEERVKQVLKKIYNDETSLRSMLRSRKRTPLHVSKASIEQVTREANRKYGDEAEVDRACQKWGSSAKPSKARRASKQKVADPAQIRVNIRFASGIAITVKMRKHDTVLDLKFCIQNKRKKKDYPVEDQRLFYQGDELVNDLTLDQCEIQEYATILCRQ